MKTTRELPPDLIYSHGDEPGFAREKTGTTFRYRDTRGKPITNEAQLKRIRALAIPPAYRDVWISPNASAHLQATGFDARGRKQYRYHPRWREFKDENKFHRMLDFAKALPALRRKVARDLGRPGLDHDKVVSAVVALLEATLIRVGNEEYARDNHHYGLTTLRDRHVELHGKHLRFHFTGKSGVERDVQLDDERLAKVVKRACSSCPGSCSSASAARTARCTRSAPKT
jgi:DNA topoisomerase-1